MGTFGRVFLSLAVVVSCLGMTHGAFLTGSREIHAAAVEGLLPQVRADPYKKLELWPVYQIFVSFKFSCATFKD